MAGMERVGESSPPGLGRLTVLAVMMAGVMAMSVYFHFVLRVETVYTHFFYVPIILAAYWWAWKGFAVAILSAASVVTCHALALGSAEIHDELMRGGVFLLVGAMASQLAVVRDRATSALRENERRLRDIIDSSPFGSHLFRLVGDRLILTGYNQTAERMLGVPHRQFVGKEIAEAFPGLEDGVIPATYARIARDGGHEVIPHLVYDWGDIAGTFEIYAFQTAPGSMATFFQEISEREQAAAQLAAEKERLAVTLRSIGDGVISTDAVGRVLLMNGTAERITGWNNQDARGLRFAEVFRLIHPVTLEPIDDPIGPVLRGEAAAGTDRQAALIDRDGAVKLVHAGCAPIRDGERGIVGVVVVLRDVTMALRVEEEARKVQRLESLGIMAGGIAHDFNNLLAGIMGNVSAAQALCDPAGPVRRHLEEAEEASRRAATLAGQLLTFAKGGEPVKRALAPEPLIAEAARFALRGTSTRLETQNGPDLWPIAADARQIAQVIHQLALNASQVMSPGGTLRIEMGNRRLEPEEVGLLPAGPYVRIDVADSGPGIPPDLMGKIFDPYFTTKPGGGGLGLPICHSIVERHGGHLGVVSPPGRGTIFTLWLPALPEHRAADPAPPPKAPGPPRGRRVLILDDEELILSMATTMLTRMGCECVGTRDGDEAVALVESALREGKPFALVILDLTIPGGPPGEVIMARMRLVDPDILGIVSSGYSEHRIMSDHRQYGFAAMLPKPYRLADLTEIINRLIPADA